MRGTRPFKGYDDGGLFSDEDWSDEEEEDGNDCTKPTRPYLRLARTDHWNKLAHSNYTSTVFENRVHVWRLPLGLSQSHYGGRKKLSAACALIAVQIAHDFITKNIPMPPTSPQDSQILPQAVLDVLINGIVNGNETHDKAMAARRNGFSGTLKKETLEETPVVEYGSMFHCPNETPREGFTVREAIGLQRPELHVVDNGHYSGPFINNLVTAMTMVVTSPHLVNVDRIPMALSAYRMGVCVVYDRPTHSILLLDSHPHVDDRKEVCGSVLCASSFEHIADFAFAVTKHVFHRVSKTTDYNVQFHITCLMLTNQMDKVHKGKIFLPGKPSMMRTPPLKPLLMKKTKIVCVGHVSSDEDREHENSSKCELHK